MNRDKKKGLKEIVFDVMEKINGDERFVCTMKMMHNPAFLLQADDLARFAYSKRPSLAHRNVVFAMCD